MGVEFAAHAREYYEGRTTFDQFAHRTMPHWRGLAAYLMRRWRAPVWVEPEDVTQDLLFGAWERVWKFDPKRGTPLAGFLVYNAVDYAKKRLHKARNAKRCGNADVNPSRMERSYVTVWGEDAERKSEALLAQGEEQFRQAEQRQLVERLYTKASTTVEKQLLRWASREGMLEDALAGDPTALVDCALAVYGEPRARKECGLSSEKQAVGLFYEASVTMAKVAIALASAA